MTHHEEISSAALIAWLVVDLLWGALMVCGCAWIVFWRGHSSWWFVPAILMASGCGAGRLYKALAKRYGVAETEGD